MFRDRPRAADVDAVERLVRLTGVFNEGEVAIARELIEENLAKGSEASGYYFLFADGAQGVDGYTCFGPIAGTAGRWELYWIAVDPHAHRSGLGARLQAASEDAVQEASIKAWRKLPGLRDRAALMPWFLSIVANECRSVRTFRSRC